LLIKVAVIIVLAFTVRRKRLYPDCCWQRPGLLQLVFYYF